MVESSPWISLSSIFMGPRRKAPGPLCLCKLVLGVRAWRWVLNTIQPTFQVLFLVGPLSSLPPLGLFSSSLLHSLLNPLISFALPLIPLRSSVVQVHSGKEEGASNPLEGRLTCSPCLAGGGV